MKVVAGYDAAVAGWVASKIPEMHDSPGFGLCVALGVADAAGDLVAGVVFHGYMPQWRTIEVSFAADRANWLTRPLATKIMAYPFAQLGVRRVSTATPKRNRRARDFVERFGFKREGLIRKGFGDDDAVLSGMLAGEWAQSRFNLKRSLSGNGP